MNELGIMLLWCALQVTLTVAVALGLSYLLGRWSPRASRTVAMSGSMLVLMLSILAWSPWPQWSWLSAHPSATASRPAPDPGLGQSVFDASPSETENDPSPQANVSPRGTPSALQSFAQLFSEALHQPAVRQRNSSSWSGIFALVFLLLALLGILHLALGLIAVRRLCLRARPLHDAQVQDVVDELRNKLNLTTAVEVLESDELAIAATVGWRRPAILLSPDWSRWSPQELRLVLAHELAHIRHNDFLCFVVARIGLALHLYHPLVHWLIGRLQLDLELAADASAAANVGDPAHYLRTLADMALRQSDRRLGWSARTFLPTRGTFLRRLEMLKNTSTRQWQPAHGPRLLAAGLLLVTGIVAAGLRGAVGADPPANPAATKTAAATTNSADWIPTEVMALAVIRPAELSANKNVGKLAETVFTEYLRKFGLTTDKVEQLTTILLPPAEQGQPPREGGSILRLKAAEQVSPPAPKDASMVTKEFMGKTYKSAGRITWAQVDPQTVLIGNEEELKRLISGGRESKSPLVNGKSWQALGNQPLLVAIDMQMVTKSLDLAGAPVALRGLLAPLWSEAAQIYVAGACDSQLKLTSTIQGRDGTTLEKTKDTLNAAQVLAKNMLGGMRQQLARAQEGERALISTMLDIADEMLNTIQIEDQAGNALSINTAVKFDPQRLASVEQAVGQARGAAQRTQSMNNLRQLTLGLYSYESVHGHLPPAVLLGKDNKGGVPHSWRVEILPYIEGQNLYNQYKFDEPWDSESNRKVLAQMPAVFRAAEDKPDSVNTGYLAVSGPGTLFGNPEGTKLTAVTDGTSNTIALIEAKQDIPWTKPVDLDFTADKPLPKLGGWREIGYNVAYSDGSVRFFPVNTDEKRLRALASIAGGEAIEP